MSSIVLIDLSALFWARWHASADEELSAAFDATVSAVRKLRAEGEFAAVCCDAPPYWRKEIYPSYKAQRDAPPPVAIEQLNRVCERLTADGMLLWKVKGFEADDLIATAVKHAIADGHAVTIAGCDKDLLQLVDSERGIEVLSTTTFARLGDKEVEEKFGVPPRSMRDVLALMGDTSDNVPGLKGVGPKTAAQLISQFGSVDGVLKNCDKIEKPKLREAVFKGADAARIAYNLVGLRTDAPLLFKEIFESREAKPRVKDWSDADDPANDDISDQAPDASPEEEKRFAEALKAAPAQPVAEPGAQQVTVETPKVLSMEAPKPAGAIVVSPREWTLALEPQNAREAKGLAAALFNSRLFPQFHNEGQFLACILRGRAVGIDAITALSNFHVIEDKLAMHAALIVGLVMRSGRAKYFQCTTATRERAVWKTHRVGNPEPIDLEFTIEDAWNLGAVQRLPDGSFKGVSRSGKPSNWDKIRRTMLCWRAGTELARREYADVVAGLYSPDELNESEAIGGQVVNGELVA